MKETAALRQDIARTLKNVRTMHNLSIEKLANLVYVSPSTWSRYERAISSPPVDIFLKAFDVLSENAMRHSLNMLYPEIYSGQNSTTNIKDLRNSACHFFMNIASDHTIREIFFIMMGKHGSNVFAQIDEFTMLDHLPLVYRFAVAQQIYTFWEIAVARGEIICPEDIMPNVENFRNGLLKGGLAVQAGQNGYTTTVNQ